MPHTFMDWLVVIGVAVAILALLVATAQLIYAAIPVHAARRAMDKGSGNVRGPRLWLVALILLGAWIAVGFDVADRHFATGPNEGGLVKGWGLTDPTLFYAIVDGNQLDYYKGLYRAVLIIRVAYSDIDRMSDTAISVSQFYTITPGSMTLAKQGAAGLRIAFGKQLPIEYNVAVIRSVFSVDQIKSLHDVEELGGVILAAPSTVAMFTDAATSPLAVCPPSPAPQVSPERK